MVDINELVAFYKKWLGFNDFYELLTYNIHLNCQEYLQNKGFLDGFILQGKSPSLQDLITCPGDVRIDVPVWFGDFSKAELRILVLGMEPRDTHPAFNIEKIANRVYGTPFGIDRWNPLSSIKFKPQNKYYRVFAELLTRSDLFIVFSDVVKDYEIIAHSQTSAQINDVFARSAFHKKAAQQLDALKEEINMIDPHYIVTLGRESYEFVSGLFPDKTVKVRHPSNGGEGLARQQLNSLFF